MGKFTPGPWDCVSEQPGGGWEQDYLHISIAAGDALIAAYDIKFAEYPGDDECMANARLIKEAPEMADELVMSANVMDEVRVMLRAKGDSAHAAELAERIRAIHALLSRIEGGP